MYLKRINMRRKQDKHVLNLQTVFMNTYQTCITFKSDGKYRIRHQIKKYLSNVCWNSGAVIGLELSFVFGQFLKWCDLIPTATTCRVLIG